MAYFLDGEGSALKALAEYQLGIGEDPDQSFEAATADYARALERNPTYFYSEANLAVLHAMRAEFEDESGRDPTTRATASLVAAQRAISIKPDMFVAHLAAAGAQLTLGRHDLSRDVGPMPAIARACSALDRCFEINPTSTSALATEGLLLSLEARWRMRNGEDPAPWFEQARAKLGAALDQNSSSEPVLSQRTRFRP
ncbi:MAG: hypothetical protein JSV80_11375 [Acidobacteriota bacterium]|nr:MAG: hypothetical protein JSV80_11375 [Acidobacteriota bacterium]